MYDFDDRAAFINGLRELADYLTDHPEIPHPLGERFIVFPEGDTDHERRTGVDRLAELLGVTPADHHGHYRAERHFGLITYSAVAISTQAQARHDADASYHGCVTPDPAPAVTP